MGGHPFQRNIPPPPANACAVLGSGIKLRLDGVAGDPLEAHVHIMGVLLHSSLLLDAHVVAVARNAYYHFRLVCFQQF